jgi:hypothetical protein
MDEWLISPIASNLKLIPVEPYLAEVEDPTPYPLPEKLDNAIETSEAVFGFWTSHVADTQETRDVFNWEISAAYHKKPRKPIYVFAEKGVPVPLMINYITVYATYDPMNQETLNRMTAKVQEIAFTYKKIEDKGKAAFAVIMGILGIGLIIGLAKE